jgi:hypothetical protein
MNLQTSFPLAKWLHNIGDGEARIDAQGPLSKVAPERGRVGETLRYKISTYKLTRKKPPTENSPKRDFRIFNVKPARVSDPRLPVQKIERR